jgi:hypothetical protein
MLFPSVPGTGHAIVNRKTTLCFRFSRTSVHENAALDFCLNSSGCRILHPSFVYRCALPTLTSAPARVSGAHLCLSRFPRAQEQRLGIWRRLHHRCFLELHFHQRCSRRHLGVPDGTGDQTRCRASARSNRGPFFAHHRMHGRVFAIEAGCETVDEILGRWSHSGWLLGVAYDHNETAVYTAAGTVFWTLIATPAPPETSATTADAREHRLGPIPRAPRASAALLS